MSRSPVRPASVRRKIESWLAEPQPGPALALKAPAEWTADPVVTVGEASVRIVPCPTPLAAYAAIASRRDGERIVLLTELSDRELGDGLLAHLSHRTVRSVDAWELVRQLFGNVPVLDPALVTAGRWVADALSDYAPPEGWPAPSGSVLTREHALRSLSAHLLGVSADGIDVAALLQWTRDPARLLRFTELPAAVLQGVGSYLVETVGEAAVPLLAAVRAGHGVDVLPLGLLAGVLWPDDRAAAGAEAAVAARARIEFWFGKTRIADGPMRTFRDATAAWAARLLDGGEIERREAHRVLARAEAIAGEVDATDLLGMSALLPQGFEQRLRRFATAVRMAVPAAVTAEPALVARAQTALTAVEEHQAGDDVRTETARMAVRLLRWLTTPDDRPDTLLAAVARQVGVDGWVDRARLDVFAGETDPRVAEAYRALHQAVDARRARHDRQFAALLAEATARDAEPGALIRVEDVLDRVVAPIIAGGNRVLLLVLDGMNVAASTELAESLTRSGALIELTPGGGQRLGILAALPTITEVSRCSLFSSRIAAGGQDAEREALRRRFPSSVLLHKARLRAGAGAALDHQVVAALANRETSLVAAVVNTIDDALDRGEPGTSDWGRDTLRAVRDLLEVASGRVVVVLSDHGHVVHRNQDAIVRLHPGGGNRWRPADTDRPAEDGEFVFSGPRVGKEGSAVVLPWREDLRYGPAKAGYHGGASPAEAVIPLLVFSGEGDSVEPGWAGGPVASPWWWHEPVTAPVPGAPARSARRRVARPPEHADALFELTVDEVPPPASPHAPVIDALLASPIYAQRRDVRAPLPDDRVAALVGVLLERNGRASFDTLAAHSGVPAHRIVGTVTALRRLLQVEGYPVLTVDPDGLTVHLDIGLLVEQFGLDSA